jgi:hypothetical protein
VWTRTRCGRGHLAEHPNGVDESDFAECWCGAPRVAVTIYSTYERTNVSVAATAAPLPNRNPRERITTLPAR